MTLTCDFDVSEEEAQHGRSLFLWNSQERQKMITQPADLLVHSGFWPSINVSLGVSLTLTVEIVQGPVL